MSTPIPQANLSPLTFEQRLPLVRGEIMARVDNLPAPDQNYQRARLWCAWIRRNVLEVPATPAPRAPRVKFNCDLFAADYAGGAV